ncbi:MAG: hypothetical protein GX915_03355 [Clostridiales bacterium]|nr:hypothetical protein [Clostridiales bacterium]
MKKIIYGILILIIAGKFLFSTNAFEGIIGIIIGGPVLILLLIIWLLKPKKHKTGYDEYDQYL